MSLIEKRIFYGRCWSYTNLVDIKKIVLLERELLITLVIEGDFDIVYSISCRLKQ